MNDYVPNTAAIDRSRSLLEKLKAPEVKVPWTVRRDELRKALAAGGDYQVKNDLATALAHTGEAGEAVVLLEQIEAEQPGLYRTAANLGTAYELSGDNQKALEWIRKGIERNAGSHEGTEWLHVRILEAKLALAADPAWLETHSVLGTRRGQDVTILANGNRGENLSPAQLEEALIYQLHERLQFVQPPDAIVADLLLALGNLVGKESSGWGGALGVFELASSYLENLPHVGPLTKAVEGGVINAKFRQSSRPKNRVADLQWPMLLLACLLLPFLVIGLKRRFEHRLG
jgi:tetratricopeptide (TPR) repeat protein